MSSRRKLGSEEALYMLDTLLVAALLFHHPKQECCVKGYHGNRRTSLADNGL